MDPEDTSFILSSQHYGVSAKPLRPLTIRQLSATKFEENLRATEPKFIFKIEGNVFETATLVGCVVFAEEISGQRRYLLEDGTARIRVWQWLPKDEDGVRSSDALGGLDQYTHKYVRVYGKPEKFNHTISLRLENIREIQDPHEIYFHTMEAMVSTLQYARGPTPKLYESSSAKVYGEAAEISTPSRAGPSSVTIPPPPRVASPPIESQQSTRVFEPLSRQSNTSSAPLQVSRSAIPTPTTRAKPSPRIPSPPPPEQTQHSGRVFESFNFSTRASSSGTPHASGSGSASSARVQPPPRMESPSPIPRPSPRREFAPHVRRRRSSSVLTYASNGTGASSPPLSRSPSPAPSKLVDARTSERGRRQNDSASIVYDSDSASESEYHSLSEQSDEEDELEELRREMDRPTTPPIHTHHSLCRCPDKSENLPTPRAGPSNRSATVTSPARTLLPDPYSSLSSLERDIVLYIQRNDGHRTIDINSIVQAAMHSNPEISTKIIGGAIDRLMSMGLIEADDNSHFCIPKAVPRYPIV